MDLTPQQIQVTASCNETLNCLTAKEQVEVLEGLLEGRKPTPKPEPVAKSGATTPKKNKEEKSTTFLKKSK